MSDAAIDPYAVLGLARNVPDSELRRVYRELVKRHHPDHNGGSAESAARFAQIQRAYAVILESRRPSGADDVEERIARIEAELKQQAAARSERRRRLRPEDSRRPTPEELGTYTTDDSLGRIIEDAAEQLADWLRREDVRRGPRA